MDERAPRRPPPIGGGTGRWSDDIDDRPRAMLPWPRWDPPPKALDWADMMDPGRLEMGPAPDESLDPPPPKRANW